MSSLNATLSLQLQKPNKRKEKQMETNKKTNEPEEHISLASARQESVISSSSSDVNTTTNTYAAPKHTHVYLKFQDTATTGMVIQLFNNEIAHFHFDTNNPKGHKDGQDGSYYMTFASSDTEITGTLYENGKRISGPHHGHSIDLDIMLPFKNNYEFIVEPDDMSNTVDITADISYSTGQGEQLEMVNSNTKYITILKDQIKVLRFSDKDNSSLRWESSNASVISIGTYSGIMTAIRTGSASISVSDGCGYCHIFHVKSVIDYVDIMPDEDGFNKVVFRSSGKVWHCINHDMIFDEETIENKTLMSLLWQRFYLNYYADDKWTKIQNYTNDEIKLLYAIDPHGIAKYVQQYAEDFHNLNDNLKYKDYIFTLIYKRKPKYFTRITNEKWVITEDLSRLSEVISESESLFGVHALWDAFTFLELCGFILDIAGIVFGCKFFAVGNIIKVRFGKIARTAIRVLSVGEAIVSGDFIKNETEEFLDKKYAQTDLMWLYKICSTVTDFHNIIESMIAKPNFYNEIINYYTDKSDYKVSITLGNGETHEIEDFSKAIKAAKINNSVI